MNAGSSTHSPTSSVVAMPAATMATSGQLLPLSVQAELLGMLVMFLESISISKK